MIKRILSLILVFCLMISALPLYTFAKETGTVKLLVRKENYRVLDVIKEGDEIFMKAEDLSFLSNFTLEEWDKGAYFTRGAKTVYVDKTRNTVSFKGSAYGLSLNPGCKTLEGISYLPASQLLPWLNLQVGVEDGVLTFLPNLFSLWDILNEFDLESYKFDLNEICNTIGISSSYLESSAFLKNNGLGALTYLVSDGNGATMGEENAYYDLFSDMIKDVSATDTSVDSWFDHYDAYCDSLDFFGGVMEVFDKDISEAFDTGNKLSFTKNALDLLVYTALFDTDGESKVDILRTLVGGADASSNKSLVKGALDVIDEYSNYWDGVFSKIKHHIFSGVKDTLNSATVLGLLNIAYKYTEKENEAIDRINLRESIMAEALDGYLCHTTEMNLSSLKDLVNFIMLYLYSYEMNYRAIAIYMESNYRGPQYAHDEYVTKANEAEKMLGYFISLSFTLEDDAESFAFKKEKAEKIREDFKKINFNLVPNVITSFTEIAIFLESMKEMGLLNLKYNLEDIDGDDTFELIAEFDAMGTEGYPSFFVIDPNALSASSYTAPTFSEYPELKVTDEGRYYIHSKVDGDYTGEDFYSINNGQWQNDFGYYAFYDYSPAEEDYVISEEEYYGSDAQSISAEAYNNLKSELTAKLKSPSFDNPDLSDVQIKCDTKTGLSQIKSYYIWHDNCYYHFDYDVNGDGIEDSAYVFYGAASFWQDKCYEIKSFGGENHLYFKDEKLTVLLAESAKEGVRLRTCRLTLPDSPINLLSGKTIIEFDEDEKSFRIGDYLYAYSPDGKPFKNENIHYLADLIGRSPEEVAAVTDVFNEAEEKGIAFGELYGSNLSFIFSENYGVPRESSTLQKLTVFPGESERCFIIKGVDTFQSPDEMLKNADNCSQFSDFNPFYGVNGDIIGYETYTTYTHLNGMLLGVKAVFDSKSLNAKLMYMEIELLYDAGDIEP